MRLTLLGCLTVVMLVACGNGSHVGGTSSGSRLASTSPAHPASPAPATEAGAISGHLSYPSSAIPGLGIYAVSVDSATYYKVESVSNQSTYTMLGVRSGDYHVYAVARWATDSPPQHFGAGFTRAVPCGLSADCSDHSPLSVHVSANATTTGVDPGDWYAEEDAYPLIPEVATVSSSPESHTYADPEAAATSLAQTTLVAKRVSGPGDCPMNAACLWFTGGRLGHNAAYYVVVAGSNHDLVHCGIYVVEGQGTWRNLDVRCSSGSAVSPSVGTGGRVQLGMGETGCVRVHSTPGLSARVVGCLKGGTAVTVDDGPYYLPTTTSTSGDGLSALDVWWHLAGKGWMVHAYIGG